VQRIQTLREEYPRWGREKLPVLPEREGTFLSAKSIDRVIARLKARGVLREPLQSRKAARCHQKRLRRPEGLVVGRPAVLVQVDTKQVPLGKGRALYQFGAVDCFSRKRVVALAPRLTSAQGAAFLKQMVAQFPFPVQAVQSDGGSQFLGTFGPTADELQLAHYFNPPNYPPGQGLYRAKLPHRRGGIPPGAELPADLGGLEAAIVSIVLCMA